MKAIRFVLSEIGIIIAWCCGVLAAINTSLLIDYARRVPYSELEDFYVASRITLVAILWYVWDTWVRRARPNDIRK